MLLGEFLEIIIPLSSGMGFMEMSLLKVKNIAGWAPNVMITLEQKCF
jgi:hypothetical protein